MAHRIWRRVLARSVHLRDRFPLRFGLKATVVHSDEGTSFYLMTGFTL